MKAYDIIKVTAELKSYYIQYRNKKSYLIGCFGTGGRRHWKYCHIGLHTAKLTCRTRTAELVEILTGSPSVGRITYTTSSVARGVVPLRHLRHVPPPVLRLWS